MKLKHTLALILFLAVAFIASQSIYASYPKKAVPLQKNLFLGFKVKAALCIAPAFSNDEISALKGWGNYKFKITTKSDSAQFYFNQGLSMYYAFHTIEAIASFVKATKLDPECAMAWYGKSLAMGPTINYPNDFAPSTGADTAAFKSKFYSEKCTQLEKDLISAIQQRYSADTTVSVKQLRTNYALAMKLVAAKYPKNADVLALYADGLLLLHPWDLYTHNFTPKPWTPELRAVLERALAINPKHPGANHYYIHTIEGAKTPELALKSAHILDTLMPSVSHITHMPSHIYIRTGDYIRGIRDNDVAVAGYHKYLKQYAPVINGGGLYEFHNVHLKVNCAQMGGNYKIAITSSDSLKTSVKDYLGLKGSDGNFMQYIYSQPIITAIRFGKWDYILKTKPVDTLHYAAVLLHFAKGLAFCAKRDAINAEQELKAFDKERADPSLKAPIDNANTPYVSTEVARLILQGKIAETRKQYATAISTLQKAIVTEDNLIYNEPRDWPIPARHYLGDVLLKLGRNVEAIAVLNNDLIVNPNNGWALTGLQTAYQNTNNKTASAKVKQELRAAWKIKDVTIERPAF